MGKSTSASSDWLKLLFQNVTWAGVGDATGIVGSTTAGSLDVSLHTADPTAAGNQTSNEISYTGYARVAVARSTGAWTVTSNSVSPAATISFGQMTAGTGGTVNFMGVGKAASGTGELLYSGSISPTIAVANGVTPQLTTSTTITES